MGPRLPVLEMDDVMEDFGMLPVLVAVVLSLQLSPDPVEGELELGVTVTVMGVGRDWPPCFGVGTIDGEGRGTDILVGSTR